MLYYASNNSVIEVRIKPCEFLEQLAQAYADDDYIASRAYACIEIIEKADCWQGHFVAAWCSVLDVRNGDYVLDVNEQDVMGRISGAYKYTRHFDYDRDDRRDLAIMLDEIVHAIDSKRC